MTKAVFDTNVFVSAILRPQGLPAKLLELAIQGRFELAGESVFDSMVVEADALKVLSEGKEIVIEGLNQNLLNKIEYHKERSVTKKKMSAIAGCGVDFSTDDYAGLAEIFDIPADDIKNIIDL